ncbi:MAG: haloacid dehalogenase [Candidatus Woesearchaeota archaeon]
MINEKDFKEMKDEMLKFDSHRELLIKKSRDVLKLSKQVIYAVHRVDMKDAEKLTKVMIAELDELNQYIKKNPKMYHQGSYKVSVQEYVEAMLFYGFVKENRLMTRKELNVDADYYLLGLADLSGELVRKAILDATNKNYESPKQIREIVAQIYQWLLEFDIRDGELRKKFDGIKYDLKKLEDLCFQLSMVH